jgi:hypothetical protein
MAKDRKEKTEKDAARQTLSGIWGTASRDDS